MSDFDRLAPTRRAALGLLGAAAVAGTLASCSQPGTGAPTADAPVTAETVAEAPEVPAAPETPAVPTFARDFQVPPIQGGLVPVITRVTTKNPIVFLTIDDGVTKKPEAIELLRKYGYPVTMFLTKNFVQEDPEYFRQLMRDGDFVENHTVSHDVSMSTKSYPYQLAEIKGMQEFAQATFGRRPTLFRPPGGAYSATMRKACADAGLRAIIDWETKANAGHMDYQYGNSLRPGDIVLMHFRPEFAADLAAFRAAHLAAGLTVVNLEHFLGVE
ncbi:polysaccharide deacetylase family protein [Sinomonas sp. JGH33]|uniref:Polysaccharide deacetylase family protein n=1 Tax=Sinomonas terricola TaxID=3110330 RepID=A0ABU5T642_9MICC|nr:polysaccharide deacetylase family protein [Sinomonas sp. JGH33]MEA5455007.1 polysaccharide deacetylase family protein [Sinomonas sp. JGH33]